MAEKDFGAKEKRDRGIVLGLLDCAMAMLLFLPLFGQSQEGSVVGVSLLDLTDAEPYTLATYYVGVGAITLLGLATLALQGGEARAWKDVCPKASLTLSSLMVLSFIASSQPYAAALTFIFLLIKASTLVKRV